MAKLVRKIDSEEQFNEKIAWYSPEEGRQDRCWLVTNTADHRAPELDSVSSMQVSKDACPTMIPTLDWLRIQAKDFLVSKYITSPSGKQYNLHVGLSTWLERRGTESEPNTAPPELHLEIYTSVIHTDDEQQCSSSISADYYGVVPFQSIGEGASTLINQRVTTRAILILGAAPKIYLKISAGEEFLKGYEIDLEDLLRQVDEKQSCSPVDANVR